MNNRRAQILGDHLHIVIAAIAGRRARARPHWVMVVDIANFLERHKITVTRHELEAAIQHSVEAGWLKAQRDPPHSVALFEPR